MKLIVAIKTFFFAILAFNLPVVEAQDWFACQIAYAAGHAEDHIQTYVDSNFVGVPHTGGKLDRHTVTITGIQDHALVFRQCAYTARVNIRYTRPRRRARNGHFKLSANLLLTEEQFCFTDIKGSDINLSTVWRRRILDRINEELPDEVCVDRDRRALTGEGAFDPEDLMAEMAQKVAGNLRGSVNGKIEMEDVDTFADFEDDEDGEVGEEFTQMDGVDEASDAVLSATEVYSED